MIFNFEFYCYNVETMAWRHKHHNTAKWFFIIIAVFVLILSWRITQPFAVVLLTAAVAAIVLTPIDNISRKVFKHPKVSAFMMVLGTFVIVLIPLFFFAMLLIEQTSELLQGALGEKGWLRTFDLTTNSFFITLPQIAQKEILELDLGGLGTGTARFVFDNLAVIFTRTADFVFGVFIFFIALYYFLSDREKIYKELLALSPLKDKMDAKIINRMIFTIRSTVFGALIVGIIQGVMAAIGMTIFHVPGALIWGALVVIAAQVPLFGVGLVMIPVVIYQFMFGTMIDAVGILIWSVVFVGFIDNLISPILIEGRTKMHAFLILIFILGGINLFGSIGFIVGPTILAALLVVVDLYQDGILEK